MIPDNGADKWAEGPMQTDRRAKNSAGAVGLQDSSLWCEGAVLRQKLQLDRPETDGQYNRRAHWT